jgi:hypothetical protein
MPIASFIAEHWPWLLALWIALAFTLGIFVGKFIRFGMGSREE